MTFSLCIITLCLGVGALVLEDANGINIEDFVRSSDCRRSGAPLQGSFSLNPTGPDNVWVSVNAHVDEELDSPLKAVVKIQRKVFWWWIKMPCVGDYGSCTYPDVCQYLPPANNGPAGSCPPYLQDLPSCQCPLRTGAYRVESNINIPSISLPSWLISGNYYVRIKVYKNNREVGCNEIYFSV